MEKINMEQLISKNYSKIVTAFLVICLFGVFYYARVYVEVLNTEDNNLRNKIKALEVNLETFESFNKELTVNAHLIGKKVGFLQKYLSVKGIKLVNIVNTGENTRNAQVSVNKLITSLELEKKGVELFYFYDHFHKSGKEHKNHAKLPKNYFLQHLSERNIVESDLKNQDTLQIPCILVLGRDNEVLTSITLDEENGIGRERVLLKSYLLKIIDQQIH